MKAFVFPGQGSQFIGMGKDLYDAFPIAREVFDEVDDALGQKLSQLIFSGDEKELGMTENTQPALMAVSVAVARIVKNAAPDLFTTAKTKYLAGHSLGEYSALTAGEAFKLADSAKLLRTRGQAMQKAVPAGIGSMAAVMGLEIPDLIEVTKQASDDQYQVSMANDNSFGQVVISGHNPAVEKAIELAKAKGAKRAIMLQVSAPFHSPLMQPAAEIMKEALASTKVMMPIMPVVANITAREVVEPEAIKELLVKQVTGQVRWRESVLYMKSTGVNQLVEMGAGKVLAGLTKRIDESVSAVSLGTAADIDAFLQTL